MTLSNAMFQQRFFLAPFLPPPLQPTDVRMSQDQVTSLVDWLQEMLHTKLEVKDVSKVVEVQQAEQLLEDHWEVRLEVEEVKKTYLRVVTDSVILDQEQKETLQEAVESLERVWEERKWEYEQCLELQQFLDLGDKLDEKVMKQEIKRSSEHPEDSMDDSGISENASFDSINTNEGLEEVWMEVEEWRTWGARMVEDDNYAAREVKEMVKVLGRRVGVLRGEEGVEEEESVEDGDISTEEEEEVFLEEDNMEEVSTEEQ